MSLFPAASHSASCAYSLDFQSDPAPPGWIFPPRRHSWAALSLLYASSLTSMRRHII